MTYNITISIQEYLEQTYPNLTNNEIDLIATDVKRRFDYQQVLDQIDNHVQKCASYANILLDESPLPRRASA